jgi:hypothetical protein
MTKNRRSKQRFDMELDLTYRTLNRRREVAQGSGTTRNMSSGGLLFRPTDHPLLEGNEVEVTIHWPALLNNASRLNLVLRGTVIRCDAMGCAVEIEHYEFRTRASLAWGTPAAGGWFSRAPHHDLASRPSAVPHVAGGNYRGPACSTALVYGQG